MSKKRYTLVLVVISLFVFFAAGSIDLDDIEVDEEFEMSEEFEATVTTGDDDEVEADSDQEAANIGDEVDMGDSVWTVIAVEDRGTELESPNEFIDSRETEGTHIWVQVKVENNSNDQQRLFETPPIKDSEGRNFSQVDVQTMYLEDGVNTMIAEAIPAGMSREFEAIYEIAPGAEGLQFMARDFEMMNTSFAPVDLGL